MNNCWSKWALSPYALMVALLAFPAIFALPPNYSYVNSLSGQFFSTLRVIPLSGTFWTLICLLFFGRKAGVWDALRRRPFFGALCGIAFYFLVVRFVTGGLIIRTLSYLESHRMPGGAESWLEYHWPVSPSDFIFLQKLPGADALFILNEEFQRAVIIGLFIKRGDRLSKAVFWSSLYFALAHGLFGLLPFYFVWGCMAGFAYGWTGSFWAPVMIHLLQNFGRHIHL